MRALLLAWPILADTALKGAVLLACCAVVTRMLRSRSAALRHMLWCSCVIGHLLLPLVTWNAPPLHWEFLPPPPWVVASAHIAQSRNGVVADVPSAALVVAVVIWMLGAAAALVRLVAAQWWTRALRRSSHHVSKGLRDALARARGESLGTRRVDLRISTGVAAPVVCGVLTPAILLPGDASMWSDAMLTAVLEHELEHVRRYDTLTQFAAHCALIVFWFDPLLWIAARQMRVERELACDDGVVRAGIRPWVYAGYLIELSRRLADVGDIVRIRTFAAVAEVGATETECRIHALLDSTLDRRRPTGGVRSTIFACVLILVVSLGALRPFRWPSVQRLTVSSAYAGHRQTQP